MNKVAIITGASQGIGAALVEAYRKLGHAVVATARGIEPSQLSEVLTVPGDLADPATADRMVETAMDAYGRIDTLVNNAGIFISKPFTDYTDEDLDAYLAVNVRGFFHVTRRAVPHLLAHGDGHIVTITTSLVDHPLSRLPSALASLTKGGLQAATRALAVEYAGRGLRVNAVSPGVVKTPMNPPETYEFAASLHPVGRMGEISDVVQAVVYLERAPFVTGEILHVDGGQSAGH